MLCVPIYCVCVFVVFGFIDFIFFFVAFYQIYLFLYSCASTVFLFLSAKKIFTAISEEKTIKYTKQPNKKIYLEVSSIEVNLIEKIYFFDANAKLKNSFNERF